MALSYMRRFQGRKFFLSTSGHTKKKASAIASRIRHQGIKARIIKQLSGGYAVYSTSQHGRVSIK